MEEWRDIKGYEGLYQVSNLGRVKSLNFNMKNVKIPSKIGLNKDLSNIKQIRFAFDKKFKKWYFIFIYETEEQIPFPYLDTMAIDLGLNNLATIVFNRSKQTYIIDGKILKCKQSYYNKKISVLQSKEMKRLSNSEKFKDTKRIKRIRKKFNNFCNNYIHVASRMIVNLALEHNCSKIVIGDFKGIKNGNHAKLFVKIPHARLIELIKYKAKKAGIKIVMINESYTSGCSCIDDYIISKECYNKKRRKKRGNFVTNNGFNINADVNGAYNILRKYLKNDIPHCLIKDIYKNLYLTYLNMYLRFKGNSTLTGGLSKVIYSPVLIHL